MTNASDLIRNNAIQDMAQLAKVRETRRVLGLYSIVARQTARLQCTPPRRGASCGRPARPVLRSSVQVPCNHSCEAIAPVRLISVHRRRNLNGDSLMHTVDRGREWPYFDVSHCSTLQSGGSAVRPDAASGRTQRLRVTGGFRVPPKRGHNQQERGP
jgi:hypothetical protein